MAASIPLIRCLCYKPECIRLFLSLSPTQAKSKLLLVQQQQLQNKTLFNSCERLLLGTLIENRIDWEKNILDNDFNLTLSTTKWGMDLGMLVVPFHDQTTATVTFMHSPTVTFMHSSGWNLAAVNQRWYFLWGKLCTFYLEILDKFGSWSSYGTALKMIQCFGIACVLWELVSLLSCF